MQGLSIVTSKKDGEMLGNGNQIYAHRIISMTVVFKTNNLQQTA